MCLYVHKHIYVYLYIHIYINGGGSSVSFGRSPRLVGRPSCVLFCTGLFLLRPAPYQAYALFCFNSRIQIVKHPAPVVGRLSCVLFCVRVFRAPGSGFQVPGLGFRVEGSGMRVLRTVSDRGVCLKKNLVCKGFFQQNQKII